MILKVSDNERCNDALVLSFAFLLPIIEKTPNLRLLGLAVLKRAITRGSPSIS